MFRLGLIQVGRCVRRTTVFNVPKPIVTRMGNHTHQAPVDISHYNNLIKTMNENKSTYDPQKILEEISEAKLEPDNTTFERLIHQYSIQGNVNGATGLLERMKDLEMELNELIFSHLIVAYAKQGEAPAILEIMQENNIEPGSKAYRAAICTLSDRLCENPEAMSEFEELCKTVLSKEPIFLTDDIIDVIKALAPHKSNPQVMELLNHLVNNPFRDIASRLRVVEAFISINEFEAASKVYWSNPYRSNNPSRPNTNSGYIKLLARNKVPIEFVLEEVKKMERNNGKLTLNLLLYHAADSQNVELLKVTLKTLRDRGRARAVHVWPLIAQSQSESDIVEVMKEYTDVMHSHELYQTFAEWVWPKFDDNFQRLFELSSDMGHDKSMLIASLVHYSYSQDKVDKLVNFVQQNPREFVEYARNPYRPDRGYRRPM